jgi:malic enzyme
MSPGKELLMDFSLKIDSSTRQEYMSVQQTGRPLLINPFTNKGTAFTARERDELDLWGLLPPAVCTIDQQLQRTYESFQAKPTDLEKFIYLTSLHDRNETLFYRLVLEHIDEMMPVVYTPVVGEACQKFSHIYRRGRGIYVSYDQRDKIEEILSNYHTTDPSVIVVTDGERILGLGDQGAGGMGIPIGKLCLYTLCAGVSPYSTIPIMLDVGTDNKDRLGDPLYLGLRQKRVRGEQYQAFVDSFVAAVKKIHPNVLLQWEDFLKENALTQLQRHRDSLCSFNDDIQGTAGVVLAGILGALRITGVELTDQILLFAGAGASAHGIADLFLSALMERGLDREEARRRVWMVDSQGLVTKGRKDLEEYKRAYARTEREIFDRGSENRAHTSLEEAVAHVRPTVLIGTSAMPGLFTRKVVETMSRCNERPIIFPLSNPTSKAECTPESAIEWSGGRAIVATGSPFPPVDYEGRRYRIGQGNNAFLFPGLGLGVTVAQARRVTDGMILDAANALAGMTTDADLQQAAVFPELRRIRDCSHAVACAVIRRAVEEGHAEADILQNLEETVRRAMWFPEYLPVRYEE